jgi:hypothetical protein
MLILPSFIKSQNEYKIFLQNLSIWIAIILVLLSIMIFLKLI